LKNIHDKEIINIIILKVYQLLINKHNIINRLSFQKIYQKIIKKISQNIYYSKKIIKLIRNIKIKKEKEEKQKEKINLSVKRLILIKIA